MRYVEGIEFRALKRNGDSNAVSEAAYDAGQILAVISRTTFPRSGWLGPGASVSAPLVEGMNRSRRFVDLCLASEHATQRVKPENRDRASALVWSFANQLASLDSETNLVRATLAAGIYCCTRLVGIGVSLLCSTGNSQLQALRSLMSGTSCAMRLWRTLSRATFFERYLQGGGRLPSGWRRLARVIDLIALCGRLTHDALPSTVTAELNELVSATIEDRDPQFS